MSMEFVAGRVVVGDDGSDNARTAARWAARWALDRGLPLTLVAAEGAVPISAEAAMVAALDAMREASEGLLRHSAEQLAAEFPELDLDTHLTDLSPAHALVSSSGKAALTVLGCSGAGVLRASLMGSVADQVITHAHGPVVVVPPRVQGDPSGPVVVGLDGSEHAREALEFAFTQARTSGRPLVALEAWEVRPTFGAMPIDVVVDRAESFTRDLDSKMASVLTPYRERFPDVQVEHRVKRGYPSEVLLDASEHASMVVVGSRGRGGFTGLLLGSTSREVLLTSRCPAAVVHRSRPRPDRGGQTQQTPQTPQTPQAPGSPAQ